LLINTSTVSRCFIIWHYLQKDYNWYSECGSSKRKDYNVYGICNFCGADWVTI